MNNEDPVFGFNIHKPDFSEVDLTARDVDRLLSRTGNGHVMEDVEDSTVRLEVYGEEGDFSYEVRVMEHDGPDWDNPTIGETDTIHSAKTKTYEGEVPEDTEVYSEAQEVEDSMFH